MSHTPLPNASVDELSAPRASYINDYSSPPTPTRASNNNTPLLTSTDKFESEGGSGAYTPPAQRRRRGLWWLIGGGVLVIVVLAVVLPVYFTVIRPNQNSDSESAGSGDVGSGSGNPASPSGATSGADGSEITLEDGSTFIYSNQFGGFWVADPDDPYNNNAQPNSWTPPLNTSWRYGEDKIYGVNLGGLFVLEPFISPALFQKYPGTSDEWELSEAMAADTASGGLDQLEEHYNTFVTEQDIAEIAGAGLNWIRLPIPYWAIDAWEGEPFLAKTSWKYILRVFEWCRKYGLRINLDLHTAPGSQNGYNHSGKGGQINFLNGVMGIANAQRLLNYIRIITQFISQPQYKDLIPVFGVINEPLLSTIGRDQLTSFYLEVHDMVRGITGYGEGNGPYISIHDGFVGLDGWHGFLPGSDRIMMDTHPYLAFSGSPNNEPIATGLEDDAGGQWPGIACEAWGPGINASMNEFGMTVSGEFSNGFNDCGLFLKGVTGTAVNPDCDLWTDASTWNETVKAGLEAFATASMDAMQNWFFWTWKIGNATSGRVETPLWSYKMGLEGGWMPRDPRTTAGKCARIGSAGTQWDGEFEPWQTGGAGAGTIAPSATSQFAWPPATVSGVDAPASLLPTYTATGTVATLTPAPVSASSVSTGDGWANTADTTSGPATIAGCSYASAWEASGAVAPTAAC